MSEHLKPKMQLLTTHLFFY